MIRRTKEELMEEAEIVKALFKQVTADTKELKKFLTFFRQAEKRSAELSGLYFRTWFDDSDALNEEYDIVFGEMGEDSVFTLLTDQQFLVQKLLLSVAKYLNRNN